MNIKKNKKSGIKNEHEKEPVLKLSERKSILIELEKLVIFNEFLDASEKSTEFLKFFYENYFEYDWAYAFIIRRSKPPNPPEPSRLITYHPKAKIKEILNFNSRINIEMIEKKGYGYDFVFDFDLSKNELSIKEGDNKYFFFPIFQQNPRVDPLIYWRQGHPTAGFIFYNSKGFFNDQMYAYEDFESLIRISNIIYKDILLESITPSSVLFLRESVRNLERMHAPQKIIQDFLLRALHVGRTQWTWDIIAIALLEIFDKVDIPSDENERYLRELKKFLKKLFDDISIAQNFAKQYINVCKKNNNLHKSAEKVLKETFEDSKDQSSKFLHYTRNFLKEFRVEYLNLLQVGAVPSSQVLIKSKENGCLESEIHSLIKKMLETNNILFELKSK